MDGEDSVRVPPSKRVDPPTTPITAPSVDAEQTLTTEDYLGQVVLLDFWATWSEQSVAELAAISALQADYADQGFTVVGLVLEGGNMENTRAALVGMEFDYPTMIVPVDILRSYGSRSIPTRVLLNQQGEVVATYSGALSFDALRQRIGELLAAANE